MKDEIDLTKTFEEDNIECLIQLRTKSKVMKVLKENFNVREMLVISEKEDGEERELSGYNGIDKTKKVLG